MRSACQFVRRSTPSCWRMPPCVLVPASSAHTRGEAARACSGSCVNAGEHLHESLRPPDAPAHMGTCTFPPVISLTHAHTPMHSRRTGTSCEGRPQLKRSATLRCAHWSFVNIARSSTVVCSHGGEDLQDRCSCQSQHVTHAVSQLVPASDQSNSCEAVPPHLCILAAEPELITIDCDLTCL